MDVPESHAGNVRMDLSVAETEVLEELKQYTARTTTSGTLEAMICGSQETNTQVVNKRA